jgi:hypothetical protein
MVAFPLEFQLGLQNPYLSAIGAQPAGELPSYSTLAGFWVILASVVLLALLAVCTPLVYRSKRAAPQPPAPSFESFEA